jgi:dTDP-4-dehydrorhamnose 3,5-epimerase
MKFIPSKLIGAYLIHLTPFEDERGSFARTFCKQEFEKQGLDFHIQQSSTAYNKKKDTLRGMHYQIAPFEEIKLIRCIQGAIYDVIIDLRPHSLTYMEWEAFELSSKNRHMLYVPKGFAHGFQTLEGDTELVYQISENYHQDSARAVRWDDPQFSIKWPDAKERILSQKDQNVADYTPEKVYATRS